jgi:TatA/E family protein of Tat protein translocase
MPFGLGMWELVIIFVVALVVFGPRKLPELGKSLGKGLSEFRRASNELKNTLDEEIRLDEHRSANAVPAPPVAAAAPELADDTASDATSDAIPEGTPQETVPRSEARS